jgi:6-phosphogluconolactonase (cycloisomerase 2 family)
MRRFLFLALSAVLASSSTAWCHPWFPWFHHRGSGAVYTMTNAKSGNAILRFHRSPQGALSPAGSFATGGAGTGAGLGNQGGLVLTWGNRRLLAVNAGSDEISVFAVWRGGLRLLDKVSSGGKNPVSIAVHGRLVYVLNAGGAVSDQDNITGFRMDWHGRLTPIPNSTRSLSAAATGPAQVGFSPDGRVLVVTEKGTNNLVTFTVDFAGRPGARRIIASSGPTPFGFAFARRDRLLVTEASGGGLSSVSSYQASRNGALVPITASLATKQKATCWLAVTRNGRFAYTTNTASSSVTGLRVDRRGRLALLDANGQSGSTGPNSRPIDMAFSSGDRFLYTLNGGNGTISAFRMQAHGSLHSLAMAAASGLPSGANGLAAH